MVIIILLLVIGAIGLVSLLLPAEIGEETYHGARPARPLAEIRDNKIYPPGG